MLFRNSPNVVWLPGFKGWALELGESQNQKFDELLQKLRSLGEKAKTTRTRLGTPLVDRVFDRVDKLSSRVAQHDGDSNPRQQPQQPQELTLVCPKCGVLAVQGAHFCSACGFDFSAEARRQLKEGFEREKLERSARTGIIF